MKLCCICILIVAFLLNSCKLGIKPDNKSALNALVEKYPELYGKGLIEQYKRARTLDDNIDSVEMQLLETAHGEKQIVILSNTKGQAYAVPFPDNDNRAYWQFFNEPNGRGLPGETFNAEMNMAFKTLSINGYLRTQIFNDMMISLIQCRPVLASDTTNMTNWFVKSTLPDSCKAISKHDFQKMFKDVIAQYRYYNTFRDMSRSRFFQVEDDDAGSGDGGYKVVVYRQPCVIKPIFL